MINRWSSALAFLLLTVQVVCLAETDRLQLRTLGEADKPRFEVTDRVWPAEPGGAEICLWKDDKLCAFSITIDDNTAVDHEWWIEQGEKYGWRVTWFVITAMVGNGEYWGTWDGFSRLRALGHDVQSHTVTHLNPDRGFTDIETEYAESARKIEEEIEGASVLTLAYPGGKNSGLNDPAVAARHYIAARGGRGTINAANQINYIQTCSVGGINIDNEKAPWANFLNMLDAERYLGRHYRGWYCCHFHGVKPDVRPGVAEAFDTIQEREEDIWVGLFREVVTYGQERDTATLTVTGRDADAIRFTLTDDMDDELFRFPLTIKVRLPTEWQAVVCEQGGRISEPVVIEHEGASFALVQAVPDQGDITLRPRTH